MRKFEVTIGIGLIGCKKKLTIEIDEDEMNEHDIDVYLWEDVVQNEIEWNWNEVE